MTNKNARKHIQLRLRQNMDSFTIGRNNRVEPVGQVQDASQGQVQGDGQGDGQVQLQGDGQGDGQGQGGVTHSQGRRLAWVEEQEA